jgi:hypothetical protein
MLASHVRFEIFRSEGSGQQGNLVHGMKHINNTNSYRQREQPHRLYKPHRALGHPRGLFGLPPLLRAQDVKDGLEAFPMSSLPSLFICAAANIIATSCGHGPPVGRGLPADRLAMATLGCGRYLPPTTRIKINVLPG